MKVSLSKVSILFHAAFSSVTIVNSFVTRHAVFSKSSFRFPYIYAADITAADITAADITAADITAADITAGEINTADVNKVRDELAKMIRENQCGPILIRLAFHDAVTYDVSTGSGGPRGCMRFSGDNSEASFEANKGLEIARELVQPIKDSVASNMSYADFWALSSIVAIKEMGGPDVKFRVGRKDAISNSEAVEEGRHPDGDKGSDHLRDVFGRMGLSDKDIVVLSGAHTTGRCHLDRSGFDGPFTEEPLKFDNSYFIDLLNKKWESTTTSKGCPQFNSGDTMMLISDLALKEDETFRPLVEKYANDEEAFFVDFSASYQKLLELGFNNLKEV